MLELKITKSEEKADIETLYSTTSQKSLQTFKKIES